MALAVAVANAVLDAILRNGTYTGPPTVYISVHTGDPGVTGANEVSNAGGSTYTRQALTIGAASSGSAANTVKAGFANMPACVATHAGLWDDVSASGLSHFLWGSEAFASSSTLTLGDTFEFPVAAATTSQI